MGPDPAVAAVRLAVRSVRLPREAGATVMVACSGGADSLALLAATVFELRRSGTRVIGAVVDHGLQAGSRERTGAVVAQMAALGVDETASIRVTVDPGPAGVEAGAREARYAALSQLAHHFGAARVLLGHTVDDQAESVLLGLTQGSGPRSLVGMRDAFALEDGSEPLFVRPLLRTVTRAQTEAACRAEGIDWWDDPHNSDPRFTRARVRHRVMPVLEKELGPGVARALARTGHLMRDDLAALDTQAQAVWRELATSDTVPLARLEQLGTALLSRVLRLAALDAGASPRELTYGHVEALTDLVRERPGEAREIQLPGHVSAVRRDGEIWFVATRRPGDPPVAG